MRNTRKKGFTIVELVIVIAVIAILAAVLIPTFSNVIGNAKKSAAQSDAKNAMTQDLIDADGDYANIKNNYKNSAGQTITSFKGTYDSSAKTYTYNDTANGYTCVYNVSTGAWTYTDTTTSSS